MERMTSTLNTDDTFVTFLSIFCEFMFIQNFLRNCRFNTQLMGHGHVFCMHACFVLLACFIR